MAAGWRDETTYDALQNKIQQVIKLSRQEAVIAAEAKLGRLLTSDERAGIHHINSMMMLESVHQSFTSPGYTTAQVLADLEHFSKQTKDMIDQNIIDFVAEFTGVKRERLTPASTLYGDLGVDGADGWELIEKFGQQFQVDLSGFRADRHFGPEGMPIYAPFMWVWFLVSSPFRKRRSAEDEADSGQ
ncbi:MAG: hypothetical protein JWR26_4080 [Pedosphaera sp.]|nr:hypothetical protein [Pedosphaera sp.]